MFWIDSEDHDWDEVSLVHACSTPTSRRARFGSRPRRARGPAGRPAAARRRRRRGTGRTGGGAAADRVHRVADDAAPRRRTSPALSTSDAFGRLARIHARRVRPHRLRRGRPGCQGRSCGDVFAREVAVPGPHGRARARGGRRSWSASAITPR
ncbi:MAG: bacillithiol biosynthesis cysteine-adding enzyme BshC [Comamonadaceae bacterium]|nr:bacillithiol biosynthesis cysteine-adding enzyme BshC [Comamonadaceae bacterium]